MPVEPVTGNSGAVWEACQRTQAKAASATLAGGRHDWPAQQPWVQQVPVGHDAVGVRSVNTTQGPTSTDKQQAPGLLVLSAWDTARYSCGTQLPGNFYRTPFNSRSPRYSFQLAPLISEIDARRCRGAGVSVRAHAMNSQVCSAYLALRHRCDAVGPLWSTK